MTTASGQQTVEENISQIEESQTQESGSQIGESFDNALSPSTSSVSTSSRRRILKKPYGKQTSSQRTTELDQQQRVLELVAEKLQNQNKYSNYAAYIGQELEALPPMMATYCQKLINDALFSAKCGQLTAQSRIITEPLINYNVHPSTYAQPLNAVPLQYENQTFSTTNPVQYENQPSNSQAPAVSRYFENFTPR